MLCFPMWLSDLMCNCALFLSYISFYGMGVCLCLYRTTWTACRYFRIVFNRGLYVFLSSSVAMTWKSVLVQSERGQTGAMDIVLWRANIMFTLDWLRFEAQTPAFFSLPPPPPPPPTPHQARSQVGDLLKVWDMTDSIKWRSLSLNQKEIFSCA